MPSPEDEEILSFALIERLAHLLNTILLVLDEVILEMALARFAHLILKQVSWLAVAVFVQVLKYRSVYVLLGSCEVV